MKWIKIKGTVYKNGCIVVLSVNLTPVFGRLRSIVVHDVNNYLLVCNVMNTICFSKHYHSYEVEETPEIVLVNHSDLYDHTPLSLYHVFNCLYVSLKYYLIENIV